MSLPTWIITVFLTALFVQLPMVFNPGFFSHDELQWASRANVGSVSQLPWVAWLDLDAYQYRPLTFNLWLWLSHHGFDHPKLFHAIWVLWGTINALMLSVIGRKRGLSQAAAWLLGLLFITSPYAMYVHGWVATLADLLVMSALLLLVYLTMSNRNGWFALLASMLFTAMALMSKESAMAIPALLGVIWLFGGRQKKWLAATVAAGFVVAAYLYLRLPVLLQQPEGTHYTLGFWHAPLRWLEYHLYWVTPVDLEPIAITSRGWHVVTAAASLLFLGFWLVLWRTSRHLFWALILGGLALLGPVLPIASSASQYGYLFSAWCLFLIVTAWPQVSHWGRHYLLLLGGLSMLHGFIVMAAMIYTGKIQSVFSPTLASLVSKQTSNEPIRLQLAPGARPWLFKRLTHDIHSYHGVVIGDRIQIVDHGMSADFLIQPEGQITSLE